MMRKNSIPFLLVVAAVVFSLPALGAQDWDDEYDEDYYYTVEDYYYLYQTSFFRPKVAMLSIVFFDARGQDAAAKGKTRLAAQALFEKVKKDAKAFDAAVKASSAAGYVAEASYLYAFNDEFLKAFGQEFRDAVDALSPGGISPLFETPSGLYLVKEIELHPSVQLGLDDPLVIGEDKTVRDYIEEQLEYLYY